MDLSDPFSAVSPGLHGRVLTVLARTEAPLTGRVIASLVRPTASVAGVQRVLDELVRQGLVRREPAGRAYLYLLNRRHLAARAVITMATMRLGLLERVAAETERWPTAPLAVWLFGSTARGESGVDSDIDLLILRPESVAPDDPDWVTAVGGLAESVRSWTGNGADIVEYTVGELRALQRRDDRLITELSRELVAIVGPLPQEVLGKELMRA